jgi:hypothetical protein
MWSFFRGWCRKKENQEDIDSSYILLKKDEEKELKSEHIILDIHSDDGNINEIKETKKLSVSRIKRSLSINRDEIEKNYFQRKLDELKKSELELKTSLHILQSYQFKQSDCFLHLMTLSITSLFAGGYAGAMILYIYEECSQFIDDNLEPLMAFYHNTTACIESNDALPLPSNFNPLLCAQYIQTFTDWMWTSKSLCSSAVYDPFYEKIYDNQTFSNINFIGGAIGVVLTILGWCFLFCGTAKYQSQNQLSAEKVNTIREHARRYGLIIPDDIDNNDISDLLTLFKEKLIQIKTDYKNYMKVNEFHKTIKINMLESRSDQTYYDNNIVHLIDKYADYGGFFASKEQARFAFLSGAHPKNEGRSIHLFFNALKAQDDYKPEKEKVLRNIMEFADIAECDSAKKAFVRRL